MTTLAFKTHNFDNATILATDILADIMQFRRFTTDESCEASCPKCSGSHLHKVVFAISQRKPVTFVLPAFPGKSPNPAKVFGPLPDMAERRALQFLNYLCDRIKQLYAPGARMILCSDGRVFSDIVGMREEDVTAYQRHLSQIIKELKLSNLSTFDLDELSVEGNFVQVRSDLMKKYGQPLEFLKEKVRRGSAGSEHPEDKEAHRMYCGITRFLFEDSIHPNQTKSRTALQKDSKVRAYEVIRRSNAWSELIAELFPEAVRLSIHPQGCGAKKMGIQLLGTDSWMTPWHGVAVETDRGFVLMKRFEAEKLSAQIVLDAEGRASHFKLVDQQRSAANEI